MKNLWIVLSIYILESLILVIVGIVAVVKKEKYSIIVVVILLILVVIVLYANIPIVKDLISNQTTEVTAVYVNYRRSGNFSLDNELIFENEGNEIIIIAPKFTRIISNLEDGKTYKVEYFNNSRVIKEYELLDAP